MVLAASLLLVVAQPLASGLLGDDRSFDILFSLLIGAVILLVVAERKHRIVAGSVGLASFLGIWIGHAMSGAPARALLVGSHLLAVIVFVFVLYRILRALLMNQASGDSIFGVVCGYLLLGIIWALLYSAVETARPGSFTSATSSKAAVAGDKLDRGTLGYYSFITLATVGYGDVIPVTPLAQTLAWLEAITGQFYLAILVAGLVGFKVSQAISEQSSKGTS